MFPGLEIFNSEKNLFRMWILHGVWILKLYWNKENKGKSDLSSRTGKLLHEQENMFKQYPQITTALPYLRAANGAVSHRWRTRQTRRAQRRADDRKGGADATDGAVDSSGGDGRQGGHGSCSWGNQRRRALARWRGRHRRTVWAAGIWSETTRGRTCKKCYTVSLKEKLGFFAHETFF